MNRQLPLTPAEAEKFQALAVGESMWLVRDGMWGWDSELEDLHGPPAVFVQACAPCETCGGSRCAVTMLGYGLLAMEKPCPDCRIELVGPCPRCEGTGNELLTMYRRCSDCHGMMTITLGYAYATGQPLPIVGDTLGIGDCLIVDPDGDVWTLIDGVYDEPITERLAHYGPPETLVGRWALQLAVTQ